MQLSVVWRESRDLVLAHRKRLALGLGLMLINRLAGLVLPTASKYLIDDVIGKRQVDMLVPIALAAAAATLVQAGTSFSISRVLACRTAPLPICASISRLILSGLRSPILIRRRRHRFPNMTDAGESATLLAPAR